MQDDKLMQAVQSIKSAAENLNQSVVILTEIINGISVVQADFVLPENWYVENSKEATEWAESNWTGDTPIEQLAFMSYNYISNTGKFGSNGHYNLDGKSSEITHDQFITHVYKPWKDSLKHGYWMYVGVDFPKMLGVIYPGTSKCTPEAHFTVYEVATHYHRNAWQPATEAEYLAQEAAKQPKQCDKSEFKVG